MTEYKAEVKHIQADNKLQAGLHAIRLISKTINSNHSEGDENTFISEVE